MNLNQLLDEPLWWNPKGRKMTRDPHSMTVSVDVKNGKSAGLQIKRSGGFQQRRKFRVSWVVKHANGETEGHIEMGELDLRRAFGLDDTLTPSGLAFAKQHDLKATSAEPGAYFRLERMLSLPNPGRCMEGDPNVCVFLTDDIKMAVETFIEGESFG